MGGVGRVACQGFLVMEACVHVLVGGAGSLLSECREVPRSEFLGVYGFGVPLDSLYIEAQGYVPVLLDNLCGMSCSVTCWPFGSAWFQCRYGGF